MTPTELLESAAHILMVNPRLFSKYLVYRTRRLTPTWRSFHPGSDPRDLNGVKFPIDFDKLGHNIYTKQMYFGYYQIALVEAMKKFLKPGDTFIDVGANVGYLTAVGASLVGTEGQVHSFEPVPKYFHILEKIALMNPEYMIVVNNYALGDETGVTRIDYTDYMHSGGSTLVPGFLEFHGVAKEGSTEVALMKLDDYIHAAGLSEVSLIKIDVEGFELPVLRGLQGYFESTSCRPIVICEITPSAYPMLGYRRSELLQYLENYGYRAYDIMNTRLRVDINKFKEGTDVIFRAQI